MKNLFHKLFLGVVFFVSMIGLSPLQGENAMKVTEPTKPMNFDKDKKYYAVIETDKGNITCVLYPQQAPLSVTNFIQLAQSGFYNGLKFHRVVPGFVIQGGDPTGTGTGGPGYTIPAEIGLPHESGALAWARLPDQANPQRRSSGSQFYITLDKVSFLDGQYTVFGQTVQGMDVIQKIKQGDVIKTIKIEEK